MLGYLETIREVQERVLAEANLAPPSSALQGGPAKKLIFAEVFLKVACVQVVDAAH